jgi:hypothetical protein
MISLSRRRKLRLWWYKTEIYIGFGGTLLMAFLVGWLFAWLTSW